MKELEAVTQMIESLEKEKIAEAIEIIECDEELKEEIDFMYGNLVIMLGDESLLDMAKLPKEWDGWMCEERAMFIDSWPEGRPFFTEVVDLSGDDDWSLMFVSPLIRLLKNIKELYLNNNPVDSLPDDMGELESLEVLNLSNTDIENLCEGFFKLSNLKKLYISGSPFADDGGIINRIKETWADIDIVS